MVLERPLALRLGVRGFCSVPPWGPGTFYSPSRTRHSGLWGVRFPWSFAFCPNPSRPRPATAQALLPPGATSFPPPGSARGQCLLSVAVPQCLAPEWLAPPCTVGSSRAGGSRLGPGASAVHPGARPGWACGSCSVKRGRASGEREYKLSYRPERR